MANLLIHGAVGTGAKTLQTVRKLAITPPLRKFDSRPVGERQ